jgi:hypothetical protein
MTEPTDPAPIPILDLAPRLAKKKADACKHDCCEVDMDAAELSCTECGAELDPWWYLRRMARDEAAEIKRKQDAIARFDAWCAQANAKSSKLTDEIAELLAVKNQLWNTPVDGVPLGSIAAKRNRRSMRNPKRA